MVNLKPKRIAATRKSAFYDDIDWQTINFRKNPELYKIGRGEQGVLLVEPYKSEILPFWRFKTPELAEQSSRKIFQLFIAYKKQGDFVGMDMARKFLQMGYTRARRYANHPSGRKYAANPQNESTSEKEKEARNKKLPQSADWATNEKAVSARIFYDRYLKARNDAKYKKLKKTWGK